MDALNTMATPPFAEAPTARARRGSLRGVYLRRLRRMVRLRHQHSQDLNQQGLRLLDRSIFAAYCDCRDAGAGHKARDVLGEVDFPTDERAGDKPVSAPSIGGGEPVPRSEG